MYPFPQVRRATDDLWVAIRRHLGWGPDRLEWEVVTPEVWHAPDLLLAQCCGWPLVAELPDSIAVVGTFDFAVPDSHDGTYRSLLVTATDRSFDELHADDGTIAAINDLASLSGCISLRHVWQGLPKHVVTGAHIKSVAEVGAGRAQIACIDAVSWSFFARHEPQLIESLRVIGQGPRIPCLPIFVPAHHAARVPELRAAFAAAIGDAAVADARAILGIRGFVPLDRADYLGVLNLV